MLERVFCCVLLIAGLTVLGGCVSQKESLVSKGAPLSYADGFDDGCHSGKKAGGSLFDQFQKDPVRFASDTLYSQGWSDGFRQCETELEFVHRETRMAMEQQRLLEEKHHHDWQEQRHLEREVMRGVDTASLQTPR
jgi:hypothetical protein